MKDKAGQENGRKAKPDTSQENKTVQYSITVTWDTHNRKKKCSHFSSMKLRAWYIEKTHAQYFA